MNAMPVLVTPRATLDDLMKVEGKAELIRGRIVASMPTGSLPTTVAANVYVSLREYAKSRGGRAYTDNVGYAVPELISGRETFSPDASFRAGPHIVDDMDFIEGPPHFAVEVRSKGDYGPAAEVEMQLKRDDYFKAGTPAVWDVDPLARTIALYVRGQAEPAAIFRSGETAHAEPALTGWRLAADEVFAV